METATFEDLLKLKLRKEEQSSEAVEFPIASLGKMLRFHAPTSVQQLDFIDAARKSGDISGCYPAYKQLVYDCCDMLHTAELQNQCDCKEPTDIVDKLAALGEAERQFLDAVRDIYMEEDSQWQAQ